MLTRVNYAVSHAHSVTIGMVGKGTDVSAKAAPTGSSVRETWNKCLLEVKQNLPEQTYQTWFLPIIPVSFIKNVLILRVPSRFFFEWIDSHYGTTLRSVVKDVFGKHAVIEFLIAPTREDLTEIPATEKVDVAAPSVEPTVQLPAAVDHSNSGVDADLTFASFVEGAGNKLAVKAAEVVAGNPGANPYNPLVLHGAAGSGKTHLTNAIGNTILEQNGSAKCYMISSERFLHEYVNAVQGNRMDRFMQKILTCKVFMLEDVQFLANKTKSQENLLFIINELLKRKAQVIITSNVAPGKLKLFNERLVSSFQKGLIADLAPNDIRTRENLIRQYTEKHAIQLEEPVIEFLAENLGSNMHQLRAVLIRIVAQISLLGGSLGLNDIRYIVSQISPDESLQGVMAPGRREIGISEICRATADFFDLPIDILQGVSRKQRIVKGRQIAIYLCRELTSDSLSSIGYHFSNLHHASVLYACNKVKKDLARNPVLKANVEKIKALLIP